MAQTPTKTLLLEFIMETVTAAIEALDGDDETGQECFLPSSGNETNELLDDDVAGGWME